MRSRGIAQLDSAREALASLDMASEDEARLWKKFTLEWNYHSNHIEGNTLTYGDTELLLVHGTVSGTHAVRDIEEMKAHDVAIRHLRELADDKRPMTESDVRYLNRILLKESFWKDAITPSGQATRIEILPGVYKEQPNNVRLPDGSTFAYATPSDVPIKMGELMSWLSEQLESVHHRFVLIHPFADGNGRTARLLMNYVLLRAEFPPVIVRTDDKEEYMACLRQADAGDMNPLAEFLARNLGWSLEVAMRAAKGESIEDDDDLDKEISIFVRGQKDVRPPVALNMFDISSVFKSVLEKLQREYIVELDTFDQLFEEVVFFLVEDGKAFSNGDPFEDFKSRILVDVIPETGISLVKIYDGFKTAAGSLGIIKVELMVSFGLEDVRLSSMVNGRLIGEGISVGYGGERLPESTTKTFIRETKRAVFDAVQELT